MVVSSVWMARQFLPATELRLIKSGDLQHLQRQAKKLERNSRRVSVEKLNILLRQMGQSRRAPMFLYDLDRQAYIWPLADNLIPDTQPFTQLLDQTRPYELITDNMAFFGPQPINLYQRPYLLFTSRPLPGGLLKDFRRRHPALNIAIAVSVSGLLCFLLAWSLARPIRQLQQTAKRMASGDLTARVGSASARRDEIGQLGQDFNCMAEQVDNLLNGQKRLLADVSHELRSPLTRLQLAIGIAQQQAESELSDSANKQLLRIDTEAGRIEQMLAKILTLSKLEAKAEDIQFKSHNLVTLCEQISADGHFEAQQNNKSLHYDHPQALSCEVDASLLASAIENVLRNAIRYAKSQVSLRLSVVDDKAVIDICDDGEGVSEQERQSIFVPFYRVSLSRNRQSGGVGLGLAIAQSAVHAHQGQISASQSASGGLQVKIVIPLRQNVTR